MILGVIYFDERDVKNIIALVILDENYIISDIIFNVMSLSNYITHMWVKNLSLHILPKSSHIFLEVWVLCMATFEIVG